MEVYTLAFYAQQGLLELFDRVVHFESLAECRRSYVTNAVGSVASQAAKRVKTEKTPSERCRKQRLRDGYDSVFRAAGLTRASGPICSL